jgi:PAS domain S-box-containing protein
MMPEIQPLRLLIIDDNADDRNRLMRSLWQGFPGAVLREITTKQEFDAALALPLFDVVVAEYWLTWTDGLKVLKKIRRHFPQMPVIWVSSTPLDELIVAGVKAGLNDFVSKKHLQRLPKIVRASIAQARVHQGDAPAHQTVRASEPPYRTISELTSDYAYFLRITPDGSVVCEWVDERFTELTGYTLEALRRHGGWSSLIHRDDLSIASQRQPCWLAGQTDIREFRIRTQSGNERWFRDYTCAVHDGSQPGVVRVYGAGQDITRRRHLEEPLRQAQKMEALGRLAGGIAHDFNNLLQVISGYSDLLLRRLTRHQGPRQYVQEIKNVAEQGAVLTRQLMTLSRKPLLQPQVLDCKHIISNMAPILQRILGEDIELITSVDATLGYVTADPGQLEQVILNLAVNARDAMPQGGRLTLEATNARMDTPLTGQLEDIAPGEYIKLVVSDTGSGIEPATQLHIFEPFFTTKEPGKGAGLGLFTIYGIVTQNGGNMQVESAPGIGTTFIIHLPRVPTPIEAAEIESVPPFAPHGAETILLVEDETVVRDLVRQVLEATGYVVLEAANGEQALQLSTGHQGPIQLLLADVVLPGLSGPEVAEQLASTRPKIQVFYMSGYAQDTIKRYRIPKRQQLFLQKPFTPATLLANVREVLDASKA